jgi:hypothetical protein
MKKILATATLALAASGVTAPLHAQLAQTLLNSLAVTAKVGTESEYVYRGKEHSDFNIQTLVNVEYTLPSTRADFNANIYAGVVAVQPVTQAANQLDFKLGSKFDYNGFTFDVGWIYHSFPNKNTVAHDYLGLPLGGFSGGYQDSITNRPDYNRSNEIAIGIGRDIEAVRVSGYLYYDFNLEQLTYEANIGYKVPVPALGAVIALNGFAGYVSAHSANGDQRAAGLERWRNDYGYLGASADIAFQLGNATQAGVGVRYAWNSDGNASDDLRLAGNTDSNVWWGLWFKFSY